MATNWAEWPASQATTLAIDTSGLKSSKQSPSLNSSALTLSRGRGTCDAPGEAPGEAGVAGASVEAEAGDPASSLREFVRADRSVVRPQISISTNARPP